MKTSETLTPNTEKKSEQNVNDIQPQGIVTIEGIDFQYKIEGSGIPILVLGRTISPPFYSKKMREKCQLIFVDNRCFIPYETPANLDSWTIGTYLDDIETIRKTLGIEKIAVLGGSAFGFLPLEYAIKYPNSISHAIVNGTPPFLNTDKYNEGAEKYWETQASQERKSAFQRGLKKLEEINNSGSERTPKQIWVDNYLSMTAKFWYDFNTDASWIFDDVYFNMDAIDNYYGKLMINYDPSPRYNQIKCPVFIANGKYDFWAVPTLWESVTKDLENFSNNIFEKSGHFPMLEEQELFDEKLLKWINSGA